MKAERAATTATEQLTDNRVMPICASARHGRKQPHEIFGIIGPLFDKTKQTTETASQPSTPLPKGLDRVKYSLG